MVFFAGGGGALQFPTKKKQPTAARVIALPTTLGLREACHLVGLSFVVSVWPTRGLLRLRCGASAFEWTWRRETAVHGGTAQGPRAVGMPLAQLVGGAPAM